MLKPLLKDRSSLLLADFNRYPVWIRVQDYDRGEPWYRGATEQTYRPWCGPLPIQPKSQFPFVLLAASFRLSSGESYLGYVQAVAKDWDLPMPLRKMRDGTLVEPKQWSSRHGGTQLSILALQCPIVFLDTKAYDLHLRRNLNLRKQCVLDFYAAIGRRPEEVFPIDFSADSTLFNGIVSGRIDGFYAFSLNKPFEIDRGERYL